MNDEVELIFIDDSQVEIIYLQKILLEIYNDTSTSFVFTFVAVIEEKKI